MSNTVSIAQFIESGRGTRFGPSWPEKKCLARTRRGSSCSNPAMKGRSRCRLHGGKSSGAKTVERKARVVAANTKHGKRSSGHVARVKAINAELRQIIYELKRDGLKASYQTI